MGVCVSSPKAHQKKMNKEIEKQIIQDQIAQTFKIKLLLLGPGECGKSTILKQMRILHMDGFSKKDLMDYVLLVHRNVITSITALIDSRETLGIKFQDQRLEEQCSTIQDLAEKQHSTLNSDSVEIVKNLWKDQGIQQCYQKRSQIQLNDSAKYFLDDLDRITSKDYVPTDQDVLRVRVATIGIVQVSFTFRKLQMHVFDVGGQKSERRKWLQCFDNVNGVIFMAALSDYDIAMREDVGKNRMADTLELFDQICNSEFFFRTDMILFLNKQDLFIEKLKYSSITVAFPDYTGSCSYDECVMYIKEKFVDLSRSEDKKIATHVTSATDTNQVKVIIDNAIGAIIQKNMKNQGLV